MNSRITASLVLYRNPPEMLNALLESFEHSTAKCHLVVSDNSPTSQLAELFQHKEWVTYIHNEGRNDGFGSGHNIALARIADSSEYHLVVNPDVTFGADEIAKMVGFLDREKDVVLLNPNILYPDGRRQYLAKRYPTLFALFLRRFAPRWVSNWTKEYMDRYEMRDMGYDKIFDVPYLSGCFMAFRSSTLKILEGFDEKFFMYLEDADITLRAAKIGRTVFFPEATIYHHWERGAYKSLKLSWVTIKSALYLFRKHHFVIY